MHGAPQVAFSATIWKIKSRTSRGISLPPARRRTLHSRAQYRRNPARCQPGTVSGATR